MLLINFIKELKKEKLLISCDEKNLDIKYISYDSRDLKKDNLFVCKGVEFKKEYLLDSIDKGTIAYVSEIDYEVDIPKIIVTDARKAMAVVGKVFYEDERVLTTISVTGTKGKTTATAFISNILHVHAKMKTAYMSSIDYYTGVREDDAHNTTEESIEIYKRIKEIKDSNIKYLTMETSSQAINLDRIYGMSFDYGVFVNIGKDHISPKEHKDLEEYISAKIAIINMCKKAVIYKHLDNYDEIIKRITVPYLTYGMTKDCDMYIKDIEKDGKINRFTVIYNKTSEIYEIAMLGSFNVLNAASAILIAKQIGVSYKDIYKGLLNTYIPGRMNVYNEENFPIIVDYAHNEISYRVLLQALKDEYPTKNLKLVFGICGEKGVNRRKDMATLAGKYASYIYLTQDDPGKYTTKETAEFITPYLDELDASYEIVDDRNDAIRKALKEATKDDLIAILGKGNERYQSTSKGYIPMLSDVDVVEEYLSLDKEEVG